MRASPFEGLGPRAIAKMDAIEFAALRELLARGFAETTAEDIAAASGTSVRTFFRYFPRGKEDVMVLQFRRWVHQLSRAMAERPSNESAWVALREVVHVIPLGDTPDGISHEAVMRHRELARRHPGLHEGITALQHALAEPLVVMAAQRMAVDPHVDLRPRLMVHAVLAAASICWLAWLADPEMDAFAAFEQALDVLGDGMTVGTATIAV